jgi:hypothetical protein
MVWIVWPLLSSTLLGFAGGYGVRELISRHRHALAREKYYARKQYQARFRQRSGGVFEPEAVVTAYITQPRITLSRHAPAVHSAVVAGQPS